LIRNIEPGTPDGGGPDNQPLEGWPGLSDDPLRSHLALAVKIRRAVVGLVPRCVADSADHATRRKDHSLQALARIASVNHVPRSLVVRSISSDVFGLEQIRASCEVNHVVGIKGP